MCAIGAAGEAQHQAAQRTITARHGKCEHSCTHLLKSHGAIQTISTCATSKATKSTRQSAHLHVRDDAAVDLLALQHLARGDVPAAHAAVFARRDRHFVAVGKDGAVHPARRAPHFSPATVPRSQQAAARDTAYECQS